MPLKFSESFFAAEETGNRGCQEGQVDQWIDADVKDTQSDYTYAL